VTTRTLVTLVALTVALAACSGGSSGSSNSTSTAQATAEPQSAATTAAVPAAPANLPVYPGATPYAEGDMSIKKCGHQGTVHSYTVAADFKTVSSWYSSNIPGAIYIDMGRAFGRGLMQADEYVSPDGSIVAAVSKLNLPAGESIPGTKGNSVMIGLGSYDPPFSGDELAALKQLNSDDPSVRQAEMAKIKAKCGASPM
jgi:hypothetical protein